ncbi:MAG: serine/threonine protein kinase [Gemmatimonadaceae bacterium]|nr:serine/threonine protein kinase [Gemmatimonadaceae bacterium]
MPIDAARWPQVTALFADLLPLHAGEREAALRRVADAEVQAEVRSLLAASDTAGSRFERAPVLTDGAEAPTHAPLRHRHDRGDRIGRWRLVRLLGEGGMGAVYEAINDDAGFTKRAALKMVSRSPADGTLVPRFEAERRILARLEHRNIAALLDGGVDDDGRPWFALEYVDGARIDQWCDTHRLDQRARVQLFRQACNAVQYAHERLVVHRDIKPANMLVAADGTVKLLDFGIAKLTDDTEHALTEFGVSPMTAAYASPEQRAGTAVTTATDIYSLGVVLHELLTGLRPDRTGGFDATPDVAARPMDAELDAIVRMAMRPEPDRRYASAQELGDDLQRWLDGRAVRAQPDTLGYRTVTFVRRNRVAVAGAALAVAALVAATVVSVRQAGIARAERDRAQREQARTARVSSFMQEVLGQARPREGGRALTVTEALDRAIPALDTAFAREPDIKAAVQLSLGSTLQELQQYARARALLEAAYGYYRTHDGPTPSRQQTDALWDLASLAQQDGNVTEAESLYVRLAGAYRRLPGYDAADPTRALIRIAGLRLDAGDLRGAVAAYDSLLPGMRLATRTDSLDRAANLGSRGVALATLGNFTRAAADFAVALAIDEKVLGPDNFATGQVLQPYAGAMMFTGRLAVAESLARRSLAIATRAFGAEASGTLAAARMLGTVLVAADRCTDAIPVFTSILSHRGPSLPDSDPSVGYSLAHRGYCRARRGDTAGGIADAREGLAISRRVLGARHYATHLAESLTGAALGHGPRALHAEAGALLRAGAEGLRRTLDPAHPRVQDADARLAAFLGSEADPSRR